MPPSFCTRPSDSASNLSTNLMEESFSSAHSAPLDWEAPFSDPKPLGKQSPSAKSTGSHESSPTFVDQFPHADDDDPIHRTLDHHRASVSTYFTPDTAILPLPFGMDHIEEASLLSNLHRSKSPYLPLAIPPPPPGPWKRAAFQLARTKQQALVSATGLLTAKVEMANPPSTSISAVQDDHGLNNSPPTTELKLRPRNSDKRSRDYTRYGVAGRTVHKEATDPAMSLTTIPTKSPEKRRYTLAVAVQQGLNHILNREHVKSHASDHVLENLETNNNNRDPAQQRQHSHSIISSQTENPELAFATAQAIRSPVSTVTEKQVAIYDTNPSTGSPTFQGLTATRDITRDNTWDHVFPTVPARRTASDSSVSSEETVQTCPNRMSQFSNLKRHPSARNPYTESRHRVEPTPQAVPMASSETEIASPDRRNAYHMHGGDRKSPKCSFQSVDNGTGSSGRNSRAGSRGAMASAPRSNQAATMSAGTPSHAHHDTRQRNHVPRTSPGTSNGYRRLPDSMSPRGQRPTKAMGMAQQPSPHEIILINVEPNLEVPLRRVPDMLKALAVDYYDTPTCPCCGEQVAVVADAAFLHCPICAEISPLFGTVWSMGNFREEPEYRRFGLGLGMTWETMKTVHQEMFPHEYWTRHNGTPGVARTHDNRQHRR